MDDLGRRLKRATDALTSSNQLARSGVTARGLALAVTHGDFVRLRAGWYVAGEYWRNSVPESQHLAAIVAAQRAATSRLTFSHRSAAVLHGLPAWSDWVCGAARAAIPDTRRVHVLGQPGGRGGATPAIVRHRSHVHAADVEEIEGLRVTRAERAVADLARTERFSLALACADATLRARARRGRVVDEAKWQEWQSSIRRIAETSCERRGVRAVRALRLLADPRADSPFESAARFRLVQLGFEVRLQVEVVVPQLGRYFVDLELVDAQVFVECDGRGKYLDPSVSGGTPEQAFFAEKRRHHGIATHTGKPLIRLESHDSRTLEGLAGVLTAHGIRVPGRPAQSHDAHIVRLLQRAG